MNNFDVISRLLKFKENSKEIFYFLQVIRRKKDNPDLYCDIKIFSKYIDSFTRFENIFHNEVLPICNHLHARCYISLVPRSIKKFGKLELKTIAEHVSDDNYSRYLDIHDSCALSKDIIQWKGILDNSRYLLDVDSKKDIPIILGNLKIKNISPEAIIDTPSGGCHIIIPGIYPEMLWKGNIKRSGDDYTFLDSSATFTYRPECNTVLYFK